MTTPRRGLLFHFTHMNNLEQIARRGLYADNSVATSDVVVVEIGHRNIKQQRRSRGVPIPPGGVVADYVPFYFAARSPMLGSIHTGRVPTYDGGQEDVAYLVSHLDELVEHELGFVFTDRNAVLEVARFGSSLDDLDEYVDWSLMEATIWKNTRSQPDRMERRMAELLVHQRVPWSAIIGVATQTEEKREFVSQVLTTVGVDTPVRTRPGWYF